MGFKAKRALDEDTVSLTVPIPGSVKNGLLDLCEVRGVSFQRLVGMLLINGLRDAAEVPRFELGESFDSIVQAFILVAKLLYNYLCLSNCLTLWRK